MQPQYKLIASGNDCDERTVNISRNQIAHPLLMKTGDYMKFFSLLIQLVERDCACINRSLMYAIIFFVTATIGAVLPPTSALASTHSH
jgi:hypothetical protein